eukprot:TRINITY_DN4941_c0_g1_i1.p1 TRINITY_DN4941_c0_g1~~TRINITY_DN4941_c0_g1_i1.p1  ORF type:complete len:232 (-),score=52.79 TRINITY_DN4941_c0_g1_i1:64-759(-)
MRGGFRMPKIPLRREFFRARPLCTNKEARDDAYRQLEKLDFMTATKMLFTAPPSKKKFGLDFHLVQFFFACMPSLAVYLVAQYARYEIRRMEAEVEMKKRVAEEEEKAKKMDSDSTEEGSDSKLSEVKARLEALEEVVKEIVDESKKQSIVTPTKDQEGSKKEKLTPADTDAQDKSKGGSPAAEGNGTKSKVGKLTPDSTRIKVSGLDSASNTALQEDKAGARKIWGGASS